MKKSVYRQMLDKWLNQQGYADICELKEVGWALLSFVQFLEFASWVTHNQPDIEIKPKEPFSG